MAYDCGYFGGYYAGVVCGNTGVAFLCGGGYGGGQYGASIFAGGVPCNGVDFNVTIPSNVEDFCILPFSCTV